MKEINSGSVDKRIEIILSAWVVIRRKDQFSAVLKSQSHCCFCLCLFAWCLDDANDSIVSVSCHYGTSSTLSLWRSHGIIALNSILKRTLNTLILLFIHWIIVIAEWPFTFFRALTHCCQQWTVGSWCLQSKDVMSALRSPHPVCTCLLVEHSQLRVALSAEHGTAWYYDATPGSQQQPSDIAGA